MMCLCLSPFVTIRDPKNIKYVEILFVTRTYNNKNAKVQISLISEYVDKFIKTIILSLYYM